MSGILQAKTVRGKVAISFNNQNKTITENGTYTADEGYTGLGEVEVNVPDKSPATIAGLIAGTLTELTIPDVCTKIKSKAFSYDTNLKRLKHTESITDIESEAFYYSILEEAYFPGITSLRAAKRAFYHCESLQSVDMPNVTNMYGYADGSGRSSENIFAYCTSLNYANFPLLQEAANNMFSHCTSLVDIKMPELTRAASYMFADCYNLISVDFTKLSGYAFSTQTPFTGCYSLKRLILRSEAPIILYSSTTMSVIFRNCYHFWGTVDATYNPEGLKDGYIYVPSALIEDYKVATNWVEFADRFRALEDYTVDGTITGALDESKI